MATKKTAPKKAVKRAAKKAAVKSPTPRKSAKDIRQERAHMAMWLLYFTYNHWVDVSGNALVLTTPSSVSRKEVLTALSAMLSTPGADPAQSAQKFLDDFSTLVMNNKSTSGVKYSDAFQAIRELWMVSLKAATGNVYFPGQICTHFSSILDLMS